MPNTRSAYALEQAKFFWERFEAALKLWAPSLEHATADERAAALGCKRTDLENWKNGKSRPGKKVSQVARLFESARALGGDPERIARYVYDGSGQLPLPTALSVQPEIADPRRLPELGEGALVVVDFQVTCRRALAALKRGDDPAPILQYALDLVDKAPEGSMPQAEPDTLVASSGRSGGIGRRARFRVYLIVYARIVNDDGVLELILRISLPCNIIHLDYSASPHLLPQMSLGKVA